MSVDEHPHQPRISRRQLLRIAGVAAVGAWALDGARLIDDSDQSVAGGSEVPAPRTSTFTFHSRPDLRIAATSTTGSYGSGSHLFLGPKAVRGAQAGPLILDQHGHPVWFEPVTRWASNVRVAQYRGAPVLTWWEGVVDKQGYGAGEGVIVDTTYREIARIRAGPRPYYRPARAHPHGAGNRAGHLSTADRRRRPVEHRRPPQRDRVRIDHPGDRRRNRPCRV